MDAATASFGQRCLLNLRQMRFTLLEFSGGLGDLGTFIPLTAALVMVSGLDPAMVLIFAGLFNITTGIMFGLPIPVQPMKAIAAVAIAEQLLPGEIAAAGLMVGAVVFLLGATNLIEKVERYVPTSVIRGIQLGIGLKLGMRGLDLVTSSGWYGPDSVAVAVLLGLLVMALRPVRRFPAALVLFGVGTVVMIFVASEAADSLKFTWPQINIIWPSTAAFQSGLWRAALPQLPLTLLNSVLAVCALSGDLFAKQRVGTRQMAMSVGVMNLIGCGLGAMPMCHGSGGLAGQYHFGARTGGSVVMLGIFKLLVGVFLGAMVLNILPFYPGSILGLLLIFAGVELALPIADQRSREKLLVVLITATGILAVNTAIGFLMGTVVATVLVAVRRRNNS